MISQLSSLVYCLPEEIWVHILDKTDVNPSLRLVSKSMQRIMETIYDKLYQEYQKLESWYLNQVLKQVTHVVQDKKFFFSKNMLGLPNCGKRHPESTQRGGNQASITCQIPKSNIGSALAVTC